MCPSSVLFTFLTFIKMKKNYIPKKVALGELYAKYSLFDAHAGNSFCFNAPPLSSSSSSRFHGNCDSIAVGVVTLVFSPMKFVNFKNELKFKLFFLKKLLSESRDSLLLTVSSLPGIGTFSDFSPTKNS